MSVVGSAGEFASSANSAAGRKPTSPFIPGWAGSSYQTLRPARRNRASDRWKYWPLGLKCLFRSFLAVSERDTILRLEKLRLQESPEASTRNFGQAYNCSLRRSLADPYLNGDLAPGASLRA